MKYRVHNRVHNTVRIEYMPKYRTPYLDESTFTVHQEYAPEYDTAPPPHHHVPTPPRVRVEYVAEYEQSTCGMLYCKSAHRVHAKYMLSTLAVRAEYTRSTCRVHELYSVLALRPRVRRRRLRLLRLIRARPLRLLIPPIDTSRGGRNHFSSCFSLSSSLGYLATLALLSCGMGEREGVGEVCYL